MPYILDQYLDEHLYFVGETFANPNGVKKKLLESSYNKLFRETTKDLKITDCITTLGTLESRQKKKQYLKIYVFISLSVTGKESKVVSEAKIQGI